MGIIARIVPGLAAELLANLPIPGSRGNSRRAGTWRIRWAHR